MNMNPNMANREVCNCVFLDYKTKAPFLYCDYANTTTTAVTGTNTFAYGGQGRPPRITFSGEKGGTIAIETQITPAKFFSLMTGADIATKASYVKREVLAAGADGEITLSETPVGAVNVFAEEDDCGTALATTGSDTTLTVTDAADGDRVVAYYWTEKTTGVQKLNIKNTTFPKAFIFQGDTFDKTESDEIMSERMIAYKCSPQPAFNISRSNTGDPASITLTCDLLVDSDGNMLDLIWDEA